MTDLSVLNRISTVLNWHIRSEKNGLCVECGHAYPCRTRLMLLARVSEAAATQPIRIK